MTTQNSPETWTRAHDLALIFISVAYGTDSELTAKEIESVTTAMRGWRPQDSIESVREIVVEALAIVDHDAAGNEVMGSIQTLSEHLSLPERRRALEDAMRIAEADGLLLSSERTLISLLATIWDLKAVEEELLASTNAEIDDRPVWSLLHDISIIGIAIAHGSTGTLDPGELQALLGRLAGWRADLDEDDLKSILVVSMDVYKNGTLTDELTRSATAIRERLPHALRLIVLDDLVAVAECDGPMNEHEREMIGSLAQAWQLGVRVRA